MSDVFRKVYTPLTDEQKARVETLKIKADELLALMIVSEAANGQRELALGRTNLEQAVMWAVKGLTA